MKDQTRVGGIPPISTTKGKGKQLVMQASTSGPKNRLDISYIFSQKTTVPEKGTKILKLF